MTEKAIWNTGVFWPNLPEEVYRIKISAPYESEAMPESQYMRQRQEWLNAHPDWPEDKELPWPPPYDIPNPLHLPEE